MFKMCKACQTALQALTHSILYANMTIIMMEYPQFTDEEWGAQRG